MLYSDTTSNDALSSQSKSRHRRRNGELNKLGIEDRPAHDWYRFVLSFPPHLVRDYLEKFHVNSHHRVLDPFCGTGTSVVECKKLGISSIGIEANPFAHFAGCVKTDWTLDADVLLHHSRKIAEEALEQLERDGVEDDPLFCDWKPRQPSPIPLRALDLAVEKLLLTDSISPLPLHKVLVLRDCLERHREERFCLSGCKFSRVQLLLPLAMVEPKSGSRVWCRQKNTRHAEAAWRIAGA